MKRYVFPSLGNPNTGYAWLTSYDYYGRHSSRILSEYAVRFETYGDGMTRHSDDSWVLMDFAGDYFASLAAKALGDVEFRASLDDYPASSELRSLVSLDAIAFLAGLKGRLDSGKGARYYSPELKQTSSSSSKEHDKRWFELPHETDSCFKEGPGTCETVWNLACRAGLIPDFSSNLRRLMTYNLIRNNTIHNCPKTAAEFFELPDSNHTLRQALDLIAGVVEMAQHENEVTRLLSCYRHNEKIEDKIEEAA